MNVVFTEDILIIIVQYYVLLRSNTIFLTRTQSFCVLIFKYINVYILTFAFTHELIFRNPSLVGSFYFLCRERYSSARDDIRFIQADTHFNIYIILVLYRNFINEISGRLEEKKCPPTK